MNMTAKEIMAFVPAPNAQAVTSICMSTYNGETVAESIEKTIKYWLEDILKGHNKVENGMWKELPFYGCTEGCFELTEAGSRKAKDKIFSLRMYDRERNDGWRTPSVKHSYRVMKVYSRTGKYADGFIPTLAQVKKVLKDISDI